MKKKIILWISLIVIIFIGSYFVWNTQKEKSKQDKEVVKIGAVLPLTGENAYYGKKAQQGYDLAIEEINSIVPNNIDISIVYEDSKAQAKEALNAFKNLITTNSQMKVTVGYLTSSEVLTVAPEANRNQIILFSTGASSPKISEAGDFVFRDVPSDVYEPKVLAKYIFNDTKIRNVGILFNNGDYGIGVVDKFTDIFTKLGGKVTIKSGYDSNMFESQLLKVISTKPNAIFIVGYKELGSLTRRIKELNYGGQILSTALYEDNDILKNAGNASEGVIFTSITFDKDMNKQTRDFYKKYLNKYNEEPDGFSAVAYDAIHILYKCLKNNPYDVNRIKENIYSIKNYQSLLGTIVFDESGDIILPIKIKTVKNGKFINLN